MLTRYACNAVIACIAVIASNELIALNGSAQRESAIVLKGHGFSRAGGGSGLQATEYATDRVGALAPER